MLQSFQDFKVEKLASPQRLSVSITSRASVHDSYVNTLIDNREHQSTMQDGRKNPASTSLDSDAQVYVCNLAEALAKPTPIAGDSEFRNTDQTPGLQLAKNT